jgi:hypothetical protein
VEQSTEPFVANMRGHALHILPHFCHAFILTVMHAVSRDKILTILILR